MIVELCEQLLLELQKSKSPVLAYLQPGISKSDVDNSLKLADIDVSLPKEVYSLYEWKNGINDEDSESTPIGELRLFKLGVFVSLNLAIDDYLGLAIRKSYWSKGLFPLFGSGGGDYYLIDTQKRSVTRGMIMYYSPSNPYFQGTASIFDSLDSCLSSIIECYRVKAYYFNPDSPYLEIEGKLEMAIWRKHNPKSEYYRILDKFK
ncbi:SMI1/KNR4 family protein [Puia dinghuensis]|uniref:Knr4/Smi1-like domain-containing protein n=1 Tax=Puia dinghuensis TaxID=1792502 RepID=A0A8J2XVY0_9BACT|nr:SMI1/KNR4 family protein [Puia dinghuensis]GGB19877.1 hypothetical protein GCM10011511_49560 [Puia dinghuensis]